MKIFGFFLVDSCAFRQELGGKDWKKSEKFPAGILLPQNHRNYPEPAVSEPDCSTWVATHNFESLIQQNRRWRHIIFETDAIKYASKGNSLLERFNAVFLLLNRISLVKKFFRIE